jgi:hypothetical protein
MELLASAGGSTSVQTMSKQLGLGGADTAKLLGAIGPSLLAGFQKQGQSAGGFAGLEKALASGQHQRYLDDPKLVTADETKTDGNRILGHLFGSKDVSRNVATEASQSTGISAELIKKALPILAGLAMGAMSKKTSGTEGQSGLGGIGALLGGLTGGGAPDLDDLKGLARKFFQ